MMAEGMSGADPRIRGPGVPFPPPFLYVAAFLAGLALERWVWRFHLGGGDARPIIVVLGWIGVVGGLAFAGWGVGTFLRARTAIIPTRPASRLVTSGPYQFSRNPMYIGLGAVYLGLAFVFDVGWPLVLFPLTLISLYLLVIRREERYLAHAFSDEYAAYARRVRRWL
jgi:protein-S-isoprenylcysteine O-methyltransferase Ste14